MKTLVQIGSEIGKDSFYDLCLKLKDKSRIFLIEANKKRIDELRTNYSEILNIHEVIILNVAIVPLPNKEKINLYHYSLYPCLCSIVNRRSLDSNFSEEVESISFNDFCKKYNISKIDYLYVSTGGADYAIINSIDDSIKIHNYRFEKWVYDGDDKNNIIPTGREEYGKIMAKLWDYENKIILVDGSNYYHLSDHDFVSDKNNGNMEYKPTNNLLLFYGRRQYASILFRYLIRDLSCNGGCIDSILLFKNTNNKDDLNYLDLILKSEYGKYIKILENVSGYSSCFDYTNKKYRPNDNFIKVDDDIVYVEKNAFNNLIKYQNENECIVSGNVVNGTCISHIHQTIGALDDEGSFNECIPLNPYHEWTHKSAEWAFKYHKNFLYNHSKKKLCKYRFNTWIYLLNDLWSINVIAWQQKLMNNIDFSKVPHYDDEAVISRDLPRITGKKARVYGEYLFSHWSYSPQRHVLEYGMNGFSLLEKYDKISRSEGICFVD